MDIAAALYIGFGTIYIICCVMDGDDVKSKWKKLIGDKLLYWSQKFIGEAPMILPPVAPMVEYVNFDAVKVTSRENVSKCMKNAITNNNDENTFIDYRIKAVRKNISKMIEKGDFIVIKTYENHNLDTVIEGFVYVGRKR